MRTQERETARRAGALAVAALLLMTVMALAGAGAGDCIPTPEGCTSDAECGDGMYCDAGECLTLGYCDVAADCYDQPIITPMCVGYFSCVLHACAWHCDTPPGQGEACGPGDACADGLTCLHYYGIAGPTGPEFTSCEIPCGAHGACPSGQRCITIADGPGSVCRPLEDCGDWYAAYVELTTDLRACTHASQCEAVPGTSCGCTRNLVVNGSNDLAPLFDFLDGMNGAGCGMISTCDCPAADGYICQDGLCAWNYL